MLAKLGGIGLVLGMLVVFRAIGTWDRPNGLPWLRLGIGVALTLGACAAVMASG